MNTFFGMGEFLTEDRVSCLLPRRKSTNEDWYLISVFNFIWTGVREGRRDGEEGRDVEEGNDEEGRNNGELGGGGSLTK